MIWKNALTVLLRTQASNQCVRSSTPRYTFANKHFRGAMSTVRFTSTDGKDDVTPQGSFCPPGSEEFCIAGHLPGEEESGEASKTNLTPTSKVECDENECKIVYTNVENSGPDSKGAKRATKGAK